MKNRLVALLRFSERYTKTDMVYLAKSGWWLTLGTITISVLSLLLYIIFARVLTKEVYGTYQYLLSISAIIGSLTLTGMNSAVARAVARGYEGTLKIAVEAQLRWGVIPFLVSLAGALYYFWNGNMVLGFGLVLISFLTPLISALNTYSAFIQGKKDFKRGYFFGLLWNVPFYGALITISFFFPSALILLGVNLVVQAVMLFFTYRATLKTFHPNTKVEPGALLYGKHLSLMGVIGSLSNQIDIVLAFHFLGAADTAIYSFATAIPERLSGLFKFLPAAALPKLSEKTPEQVRGAFGSRIWVVVLLMFLFSGLYAATAPFIYHVLFPTYASAVPYSQVYGLMIVASLSGLFTTALTASHKLRGLYIFSSVTPTVQLALQVLGTIFFGLWGLIIARLTSQILSLLLSIFLLRKKGSVKRNNSLCALDGDQERIENS